MKTQSTSQQWVELGSADLVKPEQNRTIAGVTVFNDAGRLVACETRCPHMGHPMSKGTIRNGVITCAWHKWEFDLDTGGCYRGACDDLRVFPIKIENGRCYVDRGSAATDAEREKQRLRESMMEGDTYLEAKAIARLEAAGFSPVQIAAIAAEQAFEHSVGAHQSAQAAVELQAILDATTLSKHVADEARTTVLLGGIRVAGGPSGVRPHVNALPPPHDEAKLREHLAFYTTDSSPLGIERILLSHSGDIDGVLLALATSPQFLHHREVFFAVATCLQASAIFGASFAQRRAAILGWVLGMDRAIPDADARDAQNWLEAHRADLSTHLGNGTRGIGVAEVAALTEVPRIGAVFDRVLGWLVDGISWSNLLDAISIACARRFGHLRPNNGGLWASAAIGLRYAHAIRQTNARIGGVWRLQALFHLVYHLHESRWLPSAPAWTDTPSPTDASWKEFRAAFAESNLAQAKALAIDLLGKTDRAESAGQWLLPVLEEDLGSGVLNTVAAAASESLQVDEWQPYVAGIIGYALDNRNAQDVKSAARFGQSFAGK